MPGKNRNTPTSVYLGLGSNLGDREQYILEALQFLSKEVGKIRSLSSLYETAPWGNAELKPFYNMACEISTPFNPRELLEKIESIEQKIGRTDGKGKYTNRCIDIDILLCGNQIVESEKLTVPHPGIPRRRFVLVPLNEIAADLPHPKAGLKISQMLNKCPDKSAVTLVKPLENNWG